MKSVHVLISGSVQGVGFRAFVDRHARSHGLTGWVRNLHDGRVEAVFSGEDGAVDMVIEACRKGPAGAAVRGIDAAPHAGLEAPQFVIRPTK